MKTVPHTNVGNRFEQRPSISRVNAIADASHIQNSINFCGQPAIFALFYMYKWPIEYHLLQNWSFAHNNKRQIIHLSIGIRIGCSVWQHKWAKAVVPQKLVEGQWVVLFLILWYYWEYCQKRSGRFYFGSP